MNLRKSYLYLLNSFWVSIFFFGTEYHTDTGRVVFNHRGGPTWPLTTSLGPWEGGLRLDSRAISTTTTENSEKEGRSWSLSGDRATIPGCADVAPGNSLPPPSYVDALPSTPDTIRPPPLHMPNTLHDTVDFLINIWSFILLKKFM